tara:strand:- start:47 stop:253 length:207 start_codon:yes stop_codon:yes gene_type:complete
VVLEIKMVLVEDQAEVVVTMVLVHQGHLVKDMQVVMLEVVLNLVQVVAEVLEQQAQMLDQVVQLVAMA